MCKSVKIEHSASIQTKPDLVNFAMQIFFQSELQKSLLAHTLRIKDMYLDYY